MRVQRRRQAVNELPTATPKDYGEWMESLQWDYFAGLTFRFGVTRETAVTEFHRWRRRLEQRAKRRVCWFYALEHHSSGLLHIHSLIYTAAVLTTRDVQDAWDNGYSDVARFRTDLGGAAYVLKSIKDPDSEYGFSKHLPPRRLAGAESALVHTFSASRPTCHSRISEGTGDA